MYSAYVLVALRIQTIIDKKYTFKHFVFHHFYFRFRSHCNTGMALTESNVNENSNDSSDQSMI